MKITRFEYRTASSDGPISANQLNTEFGPLGWELVDTLGPDGNGRYLVYFKREVKEDETPNTDS